MSDFSDPQNLSRYAYTLSNPLRYIDPSEHCAVAHESLGGSCMGFGFAMGMTMAGATSAAVYHEVDIVEYPELNGTVEQFPLLGEEHIQTGMADTGYSVPEVPLVLNPYPLGQEEPAFVADEGAITPPHGLMPPFSTADTRPSKQIRKSIRSLQ